MNRTSRLTLAFAASLSAAACSDAARPGGGGTVQPGFDRHGLYVANTDHGSIARLDLRSRALSTFETGREPTRIGKAGNRVYVTNRADRSVSVFEDDGTTLVQVGTIQTGAEPFGVVATAKKIYVSASIEGKVFEYDADTLAEARSWDIAGEPRGIALHESGYGLYVASTYGGQLTYIDLRSGNARDIPLPEAKGFNFETGEEISFAKRITGDPALTPDGERLAIPALYVDNVTTIPDDPTEGEGDRAPGGPGGYGGRFNPAVVSVEVDVDTGEPRPETAAAFSVVGFVNQDNGVFMPASGYPVSISFTPDSEIGLVAVEGANVVHAVDFSQHQGDQPVSGGRAAPPPDGFAAPGGPGLSFLPLTSIVTASGPVGVAVLNEDTAYVHALFDRKVQRIDLDAVRRILRPDQGGLDVAVPEPRGGLQQDQLRANAGIVLADEVLEVDVARGRRLFFASGNPTVSGEGSGVSCATCHFQGRTDGLSWNFERGPRQTPSLAGHVSLYEPVGWSGDRPTVAEDAMMTSQGLMGGQGMTQLDTLDIQAFVNFTRDIDNPLTGVDDDRIRRGAEIFAREDVGCIGCHAGPSYTNNTIVPMFELDAVKVRPLNGIRASAPYFHDGSAPTLRDVLERSRDGSMGDTSSLSDDEMSDLEFYLMSL